PRPSPPVEEREKAQDVQESKARNLLGPPLPYPLLVRAGLAIRKRGGLPRLKQRALPSFCCMASPAAARRRFICRRSRTRLNRAKAPLCWSRRFRLRRKRSSDSRRASARVHSKRSL